MIQAMRQREKNNNDDDDDEKDELTEKISKIMIEFN